MEALQSVWGRCSRDADATFTFNDAVSTIYFPAGVMCDLEGNLQAAVLPCHSRWHWAPCWGIHAERKEVQAGVSGWIGGIEGLRTVSSLSLSD